MVLNLIISIVIMILVGGLAGWAASHIVQGDDYGFWTNVLIGIAGAVLAGFLLPAFLPVGGILGAFLGALIGAIVLLLIIKMCKRCT